jgi:hypothetical protein
MCLRAGRTRAKLVEEQGRIVPCPKPRRCPNPRKPCTSWAWARHRPGAAPAAALRGRDPHREAARRARGRHGADRGDRHRQPGRVPPAPPAGGDGGRRQRHLPAALLQLLSLAAEGAGGRRAPAHARRAEGRLPRLADGASEFKAAGGDAARGADAGLPTSGRLPQAYCARRCSRPGARRPVETCRRCAAGARRGDAGRCARRCTSCTTRRPTSAWRRWKTAAIRPGSA